MSEKKEKERIYNKVLEWINENPDHFKRNCKPLYDEDNLKRIRRFDKAPIDYINERIDLNKKVSESYHKLYLSILVAGFTGLFIAFLYQSIVSLIDSIASLISTLEIKSIIPLVITNIETEFPIINRQVLWIILHLLAIVVLIIGFFIALRKKTSFLRWIGLLKVIRDAEIEVYYLSKIKEDYKKRKNES